MIQKIRCNADINRADLARMINHSQQYVTLIEQGQRRVTPEILTRIVSCAPFSDHKHKFIAQFKKQFIADLKLKKQEAFAQLPDITATNNPI